MFALRRTTDKQRKKKQTARDYHWTNPFHTFHRSFTPFLHYLQQTFGWLPLTLTKPSSTFTLVEDGREMPTNLQGMYDQTFNVTSACVWSVGFMSLSLPFPLRLISSRQFWRRVFLSTRKYQSTGGGIKWKALIKGSRANSFFPCSSSTRRWKQREQVQGRRRTRWNLPTLCW